MVEHQEGIASLLPEDGGRYDVSRIHLVHEPVPCPVHQDGPVSADGLGDEDMVIGLSRGMYLDIFHMDGAPSNIGKPGEGIAGGPGMVKGGKTGQGRLVACDHLKIGPEPAGCYHHSLCAEAVSIAAGVFNLHAGDCPVFRKKSHYLI